MHGTFEAAIERPSRHERQAKLKRLRPKKPGNARCAVKPEAMRALSEKAHYHPSVERISWNKRSVNWAGKCESPAWVEFRSRGEHMPYKKPPMWTALPGFESGDPGPERRQDVTFVEAAFPCRRCAHCMRVRRERWVTRAVDEIRFAERTWFCTYTLYPQVAHRLVEQARVRLHKAGTVYEDLSKGERFGQVCREFGELFQKYVRSLRRSRAKFRYYAVFEAHKNGWPHMHVFLHEEAYGCLKEEDLRKRWRSKHGLCEAKLVKPDTNARNAAFYVSKYIAKGALVRIRASRFYGKPAYAVARRLGLLRQPECPALRARYAEMSERANDEGLAQPLLDYRELEAEEWRDADWRRELGVWGPVPAPVVLAAELIGENWVKLPPMPPTFVDPASWESERIAVHRERSGAVATPPALLP